MDNSTTNMSDNGKTIHSMASNAPFLRAFKAGDKEEKSDIPASLPEQNSPPIMQPIKLGFSSDLPSQKTFEFGGNATSPVPGWPTGAGQGATMAIACKKMAWTGKTDEPVFGIQDKPLPMHDSKVVSSQMKPDQSHGHVTVLGGGKVETAQDIQKPTTPAVAAPAIATRKKFALRNVPKEVRVATTQAVNFGPAFVVLHVGKEDNFQTFAVHENILSSRSQQFKDHLNSLLSEHGFKVINLPDVDPYAFSLYAQLLYTGHIPSGSPTTKTADEYGPLYKLYILMRNFDDIAAQNAALDAILSKAMEPFASPEVTLPRCEHVGIIYGGTEGPYAARRLMVDLYTSQASGELLQDVFPPEFMGELAISWLDVRKDGVVGVVKAKNFYYEVVKVE
jgi:hypothetical protein